MDGSISFDSHSLQTYTPASGAGIIVNEINHTNLPTKDAQLFAIANADKSAIPKVNYPSKVVTIAGALTHTSQANLDALIDTFKGYFNGKDKNLDIAYGSSTRRYIATVNSISVVRSNKSRIARFTVEFICTYPFGRDTTQTSITNTLNHTSATLTVSPTIAGTAPTQVPIFTITLDAITGSGDFVAISNNNNNQQIVLSGLGLLAGDVIVIDCDERTVTVNGNPVDYFGTFLELELGSNSLTYSDGFDTRTVDIVAGYYKRWQ